MAMDMAMVRVLDLERDAGRAFAAIGMPRRRAAAQRIPGDAPRVAMRRELGGGPP
jgi:hypothetical protein